MNPNLKTDIPEVFKANAVQKHGVVYAETRRTDDSTLAGNFHDNDLVISEKNYLQADPSISFEAWGEQVRRGFIELSAAARKQLGLNAIGHPTPIHGVDLLYLDDQMDLVQPNILLPLRPKADATVISKLGYASCFAPADCVISNIVDTRTGNLSQIHTGYVGLENSVIDKAFTQINHLVNPRHSVAYLAPHAQNDYIINLQNNNLVERFSANPLMQPHLERRANGSVAFNLTSATIAQLVAAGMNPDNIQVSPDNSLTDPTLFSQSSFYTRGLNGRNGIIFGRTNKLQ